MTINVVCKRIDVFLTTVCTILNRCLYCSVLLKEMTCDIDVPLLYCDFDAVRNDVDRFAIFISKLLLQLWESRSWISKIYGNIKRTL